jgi:hypothetical protein
VSGGTGSGNGVFLSELFESDFLGMLDGTFLLHDGVLNGLLLGDHGSHSVVLLLESFSKEFNLVSLSGSLLGEVIDVLLLDRDSVGAGSLLSNLLLEETSKLLVFLEVSNTLGNKNLGLSNDLCESHVSGLLGLEELLERVELESGSTLVEDKVHAVPSTT